MEAMILYFVLFFPASLTSPLYEGGAISFSILRELSRILTYTIPSFALLWYLIGSHVGVLGKKGLSALKKKPCREDFLTLAVGFPGLACIGLCISFFTWLFSAYPELKVPPGIEAPANTAGWIVMVFSCLCTGYLEESYFRYYLLTKLKKQIPQEVIRVIFSTALFSLCHFYEGPWGVLNAILAGILLSALFIRCKSLHGIAWAHAAYNIFVYIIGIFGNH